MVSVSSSPIRCGMNVRAPCASLHGEHYTTQQSFNRSAARVRVTVAGTSMCPYTKLSGFSRCAALFYICLRCQPKLRIIHVHRSILVYRSASSHGPNPACIESVVQEACVGPPHACASRSADDRGSGVQSVSRHKVRPLTIIGR